MDQIFHEKQEGSLCAQHCLNALLQGSYFTAVDLSELANQLDEVERQHMAAGGEDTVEYLQFLQNGSSNMDDSGFFSVQVLSKALDVWGLELIPFNRSGDQFAEAARASPVSQVAYICNFRQHWFAIRKLGHQWFNLNSLLSGPELISDSYLSLFLAQLQQEGYSIFIVIGDLPRNNAHELLLSQRAVQTTRPTLFSSKETSQKGSESPAASDVDSDLRRALAESRLAADREDLTLQQILAATSTRNQSEEEEEDLVRALALSQSPEAGTQVVTEDELTRAIAMSLEAAGTAEQATETAPHVTPSAEELRRRRCQFLDKLEAGGVPPATDSQK